jgi:hypothetical protein
MEATSSGVLPRLLIRSNQRARCLRPRTGLRKWIDGAVKIPESGGPNPGRMHTGRFPIFRGLYDMAQQLHVHFVTLCLSACGTARGSWYAMKSRISFSNARRFGHLPY